jgi:hypothetical protein
VDVSSADTTVASHFLVTRSMIATTEAVLQREKCVAS